MDVGYAPGDYKLKKPDILYTIATIPKKSGKRRILEIPNKRLKLEQRRMLDLYIYKAGAHRSSHGFVKGRSPITNAKVHVGASIIIKLDIKDFFRRTKKSIVKSCVEASKDYMGLTSADIDLMLDLTTYKKHLPTGAPTSPALGNICLKATDRHMYRYCRSNNLRYSRYADDITISSENRLDKQTIKVIIQMVQSALKFRGHVLNYKKIRVFSKKHRMEVTGVVINKGINISKRYRNNVRAAIHQIKDDKDVEKIEGRIEWVRQCAPHHAKKLQSQLSQKKLSMQKN